MVTGASGYLGDALARRLAARGDEVHVFQRSDCPRLAALGATVHRGDLRDGEALCRAAAGADVVFHNAAKVGMWGAYEEFAAINVTGTENVVSACRAGGVKRLVFTSSASVVFDRHAQEGIDESAPYPRRHLCHYTRTKAEAERLVLSAAAGDLATVALRPHLVWGPGDPQLIGRLLQRVRQGPIRLVGDGQNWIDSTYIDNAVAAHLLADERLAPTAPCCGHAYFITNGEPKPVAELVNGILAAADLPPASGSVSARAAYGVAAVLEWIHRAFRLKADPQITRFVVREFTTAHWYNIRAAQRDLGYEPAVTIAEGLRRLHASFFPP